MESFTYQDAKRTWTALAEKLMRPYFDEKALGKKEANSWLNMSSCATEAQAFLKSYLKFSMGSLQLPQEQIIDLYFNDDNWHLKEQNRVLTLKIFLYGVLNLLLCPQAPG